jgi:RNA polymerase sigma-70 factor (ECF subfamily)
MHRSRQAKFGLLIEAYAADLYRYGVWLCGDRAIAEELVQETYMRVWRSLPSLRDDRHAKPWLFGLLKREHARLHASSHARDMQTGIDGVVDAARFDAGTEAFALRRALAALAIEHREPLVLQVIAGFSCEDIAQVLGLEPRTVMTHIFRARKRLRDALSSSRSDRSHKVMA